ncbi:DEAD/DEAH box helicase [Propionibacterium australiense]|uniref:DEAD/DEAH box helicase n=1 Tax=Propionibacterium australiense TaxID=119981 RepID=A0A383S609_9ACTN|nr:DEAD/DEAH box helicase [Propionibacterium australiense]RLP09785.1 DEAD/DEAH box helicase [Propionibacterium australiense]RLP10166.1 DEAD/DEAH box helicase [Propionibacterium australiense]SYZ33263.1 Superfamilies 1 and 2 helicase C-terminal domain profile [Propionibacterium australiense]VEH89243.1 ATP-dependent helicase [Propionibacterium australiense]
MAVPEWLSADPSAILVDHRDAVPGRRGRWPSWFGDEHRRRLAEHGIESPWEHQALVAEHMHAGRHVAVSTPTASGKTLAYLTAIIADTASSESAAGRVARPGGAPPGGRGAVRAGHAATTSAARSLLGIGREPTALYLAPTKALAHDQRRAARELGPAHWRIAVVDGDSDAAARRFAREHAGYVLTNPDMLHHAILPRHGRWARLLGGLRYVVVDEGHRYRGVFGAQVAGVLRRLRRLCRAYGSDPVFVVTSAGSAAAGESAARLIGESEAIAEVTLDGAPHPARDVVLWRPEGDVYADTAMLLARLVDSGRQTIAFVPSRAQSELVAERAAGQLHTRRRVLAYRAGYLARDRREIERGLTSGELAGVAATNALELGVDIAGMDAVLVCGFPGTMASLWQQAGRAGRADRDALVVLLASQNPLDAYLFAHPELIFDAPVERTVLNPENPHVLGPQLAAAAQEMPLQQADERWFGTAMSALADQLTAAGLLRHRPNGWFWPRPERAVDAIDLRGLGGRPMDIVESDSGRVLGQVDVEAADRSVFPGAVYLHQGEQYVVDEYAPERREALVHRQRPGYHTQPLSTTQARILREDDHKRFGVTQVSTGDIELVTQVIGYLRRDELTGQVWDETPLDLEEHRMVTRATWWTVPPAVAEELGFSAVRLGNAAHAVEHTAIGLLPAFAPCDRWDIGGVSMVVHPDTELCTIIVHDGVAGGAGFAARGYAAADEWGRATLERLLGCTCLDGCPACIVSPKCGNANQHLDKQAAGRLLAALMVRPGRAGRSRPGCSLGPRRG